MLPDAVKPLLQNVVHVDRALLFVPEQVPRFVLGGRTGPDRQLGRQYAEGPASEPSEHVMTNVPDCDCVYALGSHTVWQVCPLCSVATHVPASLYPSTVS